MSTKSSENKKLNPQIMGIEIGIRTLRKIKIYPLAAGPQLELIDKIAVAATLLSDAKNEETVGNLIGIIRKEIPEIVSQIIPIDENAATVLNEMSIKQLEELISLVYRMNFESIVKNLQGLFGQIIAGAEIVKELRSHSKSQ